MTVTDAPDPGPPTSPLWRVWQGASVANRVLAGDPVIQAIISDELAVLRERLVEVMVVEDDLRDAVSTVIMSWLLFVRTLCVDWLVRPAMTRAELRTVCSGALLGALASFEDSVAETASKA